MLRTLLARAPYDLVLDKVLQFSFVTIFTGEKGGVTNLSLNDLKIEKFTQCERSNLES